MPGIPRPAKGSTPVRLGGPTRFSKWSRGWLAGQQGLSGAGKEFLQGIDPRTRQGAIGLAGMLLPGKPNAENALAAHLGHSDFRPYGIPNPNRRAAEPVFNDPMHHGGMLNRGGDIGYYNSANATYADRAIGPRVPGGIYRSGYSGEAYHVHSVKKSPDGNNWNITVETVPEKGMQNYGKRTHATAWEHGKDQILHQPETPKSDSVGSFHEKDVHNLLSSLSTLNPQMRQRLNHETLQSSLWKAYRRKGLNN